MKKIFVTDWMLVPAFLLSAYSGIELHAAGHWAAHEVWHNWAVFHIITSLTCLTLAGVHVSQHRGWYKGLVTALFAVCHLVKRFTILRRTLPFRL